jgi:chemotaxis protein methyltransferase CheR
MSFSEALHMKTQTVTAAKLTDADLDGIRALIEQRSAILFDSSRERFFSLRIREFIEEQGKASGAELLHQLRGSVAAYDALLERLLTQETSFFRYPDFFAALERKILPALQKQKGAGSDRTLRIWSAGCSTGEEPYSVAICLSEALKVAGGWDVEILATDVSRRALQQAENGTYAERSLQSLPREYVEAYFSAVKQGFQVKQRIRKMISFAQMNLAEPTYLGKIDCIFCMNVLIYFSKSRRIEVLRHFYHTLEPGGFFLVGHAETLSDADLPFEPVLHGDCRIYRKPAGAKSPAALPAETAR